MTPEQLKQWRKANGYTQTRLARALDVYQVTIARWETGVREIPSFLHLALRCLELEGGEPLEGATRKRKRKGGVNHGQYLQAEERQIMDYQVLSERETLP